MRSENSKGIATIHKLDDKAIYTYEFESWTWEDEFLVLISPDKRIYINREEIDTVELEFV